MHNYGRNAGFGGGAFEDHVHQYFVQEEMIQVTSTMRTAIGKAAESQRVPLAIAVADDSMREARARVIQEAAIKGVPLFIPNVRPKRIDGSERFPTILAEMLCSHPQKAKLSNDVLMKQVSDQLQLDTPLSGNHMSKNLSVAALAHVSRILAKYGFDGSSIRKGTDIKRLIRGGRKVPNACIRRKQVNTEFQPDGVMLDGRKYQYRKRERKAQGAALHDFCVRVAGVDVPLIAVLALRGVGVQEFMDADDLAMEHGSLERLASRHGIDTVPREVPKHSPRCPRCSGKLSDTHPRILARDLVQAWWIDHSDIGRGTEGLRAMLRHFSDMQGDPIAIAQAQANIAAWGAADVCSSTTDHGAIP